MPQQIPLRRYPPSFRAAINLAHMTRVYVIECVSTQQADGLRRRLYNYRYALRDEAPESSLYQKIKQLTFHLDGTSVIIRHKEDTQSKYRDVLEGDQNEYPQS